jgi:hypothetical protein
MAEVAIRSETSLSETAGNIMESVVQGNLVKLTPAERAVYLVEVCESLGLNPRTFPFRFLTLDGKTVLYATKDCTDQLRKLYQVSCVIDRAEEAGEYYLVVARATLPSGRTDSSVGAVSLKGLVGQARCNAIMKCETKAKRRVTLSICGLGFLDESEVQDISGAVQEPDPPVTATTAPVYTETKKPEVKPQESNPITNDQIGDISFLINELKIPSKQVKENFRTRYGVSTMAELSGSQAETIIKNLKKKLEPSKN